MTEKSVHFQKRKTQRTMYKEYGRVSEVVDGKRNYYYYYEFGSAPDKFTSLEDMYKDIDNAVEELLQIKKDMENDCSDAS